MGGSRGFGEKNLVQKDFEMKTASRQTDRQTDRQTAKFAIVPGRNVFHHSGVYISRER